jgi:hypothetical protein
MREVRPLRSAGITPLPHYYEPVRLPAEAATWLWIPTPRCAQAALRRVSRDPAFLCRRAPSPLTPGSPRRARARCFRRSRRLRHRRKIGRCHWCHEAESGSLSLGSRLRSRYPFGQRPGNRPPDRSVSRRQLPFDARPELHVERAIHMADTSQSAREMRVNPAQPTTTKKTPQRNSSRAS